jgi:hypothetical protein
VKPAGQSAKKPAQGSSTAHKRKKAAKPQQK